MKRKVFREILILILCFALGFGLGFVFDTVLAPKGPVFVDEPLVLLRDYGHILHYDYDRGVWTDDIETNDEDTHLDVYDEWTNTTFTGGGWYTAAAARKED